MAGTEVISVFGFYVLNQDEIGACMTLGSFSGIIQPGPGFKFPLFQRIVKTKKSLQTIDLPDQQIVLSGNIAVTISDQMGRIATDPAIPAKHPEIMKTTALV